MGGVVVVVAAPCGVAVVVAVVMPWLSLSCRHWTTKEEVSRKKKKEKVPAGRRGACSHEGHSNMMHAGAGTWRGGGMSVSSQSGVGPGRPSRERATCGPQAHRVSLQHLTNLFNYLISEYYLDGDLKHRLETPTG